MFPGGGVESLVFIEESCCAAEQCGRVGLHAVPLTVLLGAVQGGVVGEDSPQVLGLGQMGGDGIGEPPPRRDLLDLSAASRCSRAVCGSRIWPEHAGFSASVDSSLSSSRPSAYS